MSNRCLGFGSIILEVPLDRDYPVDTVVYAIPLPDVSAGDVATAPRAPPPVANMPPSFNDTPTRLSSYSSNKFRCEYSIYLTTSSER